MLVINFLLYHALPSMVNVLIFALLLRYSIFRKITPPKSFLYSISVPTPIVSFLISMGSTEKNDFIVIFVKYLVAAVILAVLYLAIYYLFLRKKNNLQPKE